MPARPEGTGRHGRPASHRAPSPDERPDLGGYDDAGRPGYDSSQAGYDNGGQPGYPEAGQPGYADGGQPGYDNGGQPGYAEAGQPGYAEQGQPGYADGGYADPRADYARPGPEYDRPRTPYDDPRPEPSDPRPEYATPPPGLEAPRADYEAPRADYDRPRSRVAERQRGAERPARGSRPGHPEREMWDRDPFSENDESDLPPWAGPSIYATRAGGRRMGPPGEQAEQADLAEQAGPPGQAGPAVDTEPASDGPADPAGPAAPAAPAGPRRRGRGRAAAARLRKSRRRVYILCGAAISVAVIIAVVAVIIELPSPKPKSQFINSLQAGEFKAVPNSCTAVSPSLLSQNVPGAARKVTPTGNGSNSSQCSFAVDKRPVFRVLQISIQAFQPSLVVAGNGSATAGARDAYTADQQALVSPSKKSPLPKATITNVTGLGQQALSALQVLHKPRTVTDFLTVLVRDRNVLITVSMQAQAKGGHYGPVSAPALASGLQSVARAVLAKAEAEATVKKG